MKTRPGFVTFVALTVLSYSIWSGLRLANAIQYWQLYEKYHVFPGPFYFALEGVLGILAGLFLGIGLLKSLRMSYRLTPWVLGFYLLWWWVDRLFFQQGSRTFFLPGLWPTLLIISMIAGLQLPAVKKYFAERE